MAFGTATTLAQIWRNLGLNYVLQPHAPKVSTSVAPRATARDTNQASTWKRQTKIQSVQKQDAPVEPKVLPKPKLQVHAWPPVWQEMLKKVQAAKIIWTYPELGLDLQREETANLALRRTFFKTLFARPALKGVKQSFWPYAVKNSAAEIEVHADLFWAGVRALG